MPWGSLGTIWAELSLNYEGLKQGVQEASRQVEALDRSLNERFRAIGEAFSQVGRSLSLGLTAPLAALGGIAAKASMDFETSMANVWTLLDVGRDKIQAMSQEVEALSLRVPQSAKQLADGLYQVISASVPAEKAMYVLEVAAKAASAGLADTYTSVDAITTVLNAYQLAADEAGRVSDIMFKTVERGKITYQEMAATMGQVISTAAEAGVAFEEVAGAYAMLTRNGVQAEQAATGIAYAIRSIVAPTESALKAAEEYGVQLGEQVLASKGFVGVLQDIYQATGGSQEALAKLMGSIEGARAVTVLARDAAQEYIRDIQAMAGAAGAAERAFEKQAQTAAAQFQIFKNEVTALARSFGAELIPVLNTGIEAVKPIIEAFRDLPSGVKEAAIEFGLFAAAIGPVLAGLGSLIGLLTGPAGIALAIGAVVAAINGWVRASEDVAEQLTRQARNAQETIDKLRSQADEYGNQARAIEDLLRRYDDLQEKSKTSKEAQAELQEVIKKIGEIAPEVVTKWDDMGNAIEINADKARQSMLGLLEVRKALLETALARAEFEIPQLEATIERLRPLVEQATKDLEAAKQRLRAAEKNWAEVQKLDVRWKAAKSEEERDRIAQEAIKKGLADSTLAVKNWNVFVQNWGLALKEAQKNLDQTAAKGEKLSSAFFDAQQRLVEIKADAKELDAIVAAINKKGLSAGIAPAPQAGAQTPIARAKTTAASIPAKELSKKELSEFEQFGLKVKALSKDAFGVLQQAWADIEAGLKSEDIVVKTWAEQRARDLLNVITEAIAQFGGDWLKAASAASIEVKSGYQRIKEKAQEGQSELAKALASFRAEVAIRGLGVQEQIEGLEKIKAGYKGTADEQRQIEVQLAGLREELRQKNVRGAYEEYQFYAELYDYDAQNHIDHLNRLLQNTQLNADERKKLSQELALWEKKQKDEEIAYKKKVEDAWNTYYLESGKKTKADLLREEVKRREGELEAARKAGKGIELAEAAVAQAKLDLNKQLHQDDEERFRFLVQMGALSLQEQLDQIQKWIAAETEGSETWRKYKLEERDLLQKIADEEKRKAKEAIEAQDERVRAIVEGIDRQARLEDWSFAKHADALQKVLDTEQMSARLRSDLAYQVALDRKRAAEEAAKAEKEAAEKAQKEAEKQAKEAERLAKEQEQKQDERVRSRIEAIQRQATLEEWSLNRIADAIQSVLDTEQMTAELRSDLEYQVALNRKKAADEAQREAERQAKEAERLAKEQEQKQDALVKSRIEDIQKQATLEDWSLAKQADAIQQVLDTEQMTAKLRADLAYQVALLRKRYAEEVAEAEKEAAEKAKQEAEKQAREAERKAQEEARKQDERVRDRVEAIRRQATLEEWSYNRIADEIQKVLDEEKMSAELRSDLAYEVALSRKKAADLAAEAEKEAREKAQKEAERQAKEEERRQDELVRDRVEAIQRQATLEEWSLDKVADKIQEVLDTERMTAKLRSDLEYEVALNRKRARDEAAKEAEKQAKEAERQAQEEARRRDEIARQAVEAVEREARLRDWSLTQEADKIQEVLEQYQMSAELRGDLEYKVAMLRKQASDEATREEKRKAEDWAKTMERIDAEIATSYEARLDRIVNEGAKLLANAKNEAERQKILVKIAQDAAKVHKEAAEEQVAQAQEVAKTNVQAAIAMLQEWRESYANMGLAGQLAVQVIDKALADFNQKVQATTAEMASYVDSRTKDSLLVALESLDQQRKEKEAAVKDQALVDAWYNERVEEETEKALKTRIGAIDRMNEEEVTKAQATLDAIRAIVIAKVGAESDAAKAIEAIQTELNMRLYQLSQERAEKDKELAEARIEHEREVAQELAELRGQDEEAYMLSLEQKIAALRKAGWTESEIIAWAVAHGEKVRRDAAQAEYEFRKKLGLVSLQEQIRHEQELAEKSQWSIEKRATAAQNYYGALMDLVKEAKLDELKAIRDTLDAQLKKYEAMGEEWEVYVLAVKAALQEVDHLITDKSKGWAARLGESFLDALGDLGRMIQTFQRGYQEGGIWRGLADVFVELISKSKAFAAILDAINPIIQALADMLGELLAPLAPLIKILAQILLPIIKAVGEVFRWVADVIVGIWNAIASVINFLFGWLGVHIPTIEPTWREESGLEEPAETGKKQGTQISEITGPTRDLLVELLRPLTVLDSLPVYAMAIEKAIYEMRDAFLAFVGMNMAVERGAAAVVNEYHIQTINIYSSGKEDFDQLMTSLARRAELAALGSGA